MTLLKPKEAATLLRVSPATLRWWRYAGKGPPVVQVGPATFRYSEDALIAYIEKGYVASLCGRREESHVGI
jgi:predicted site-specific integrase-resolvase